MKPRVLIIDDELSICITLVMALQQKYDAAYALKAEEGLRMLEQGGYDLVFLDLKIGEYNGMELLQKIKEMDSTIAVIIMTAYASIGSTVEAMRKGAFTYLTKPLCIEEMMICAEQALSIRKLNERVLYLNSELNARNHYFGMVGKSQRMRDIYTLIEKIKDVNTAVTISGESGTGKELVAKAIHYSSARRNERFVAVNCAAIPEGLLEEELFGHKKGSFTGALADRPGMFAAGDKGTIFLDEIADLPLAMQSKVLRVLQDKSFTPIGCNDVKTVDIRVIAATNRDLEEMVRLGTFRLDLYYRINVVRINLPPLRERRQDIPSLCHHFIEIYSKDHHKIVTSLTKDSERMLMEYDYPGNIRELANIMELAVILCAGDTIGIKDVMAQMSRSSCTSQTHPQENATLLGPFTSMTLKEIEKEVIMARLRGNNGHQKRTAQQLGISVKGLRNKIHYYNLANGK
ncbi:MAG: sigma-54-dependent transcriptional regulator [Spirochaetales bacterium]